MIGDDKIIKHRTARMAILLDTSMWSRLDTDLEGYIYVKLADLS